MLNRFLHRILPRVCGTGAKRSSVLLSLASVYLWDEEGIGRQDFHHTIREFWRMYRGHQLNNFSSLKQLNHQAYGAGGEGGGAGQSAVLDDELNDDDVCDEEWEAIIMKDHFQVYRKLVPGSSYLYQYKIFGTYDDIPGKAFFLVQLDTTFRKVWDKLVIKLDVVDAESKIMRKDPDYESMIDNEKQNFDSKNQVVHWVMHYPYPMYCREYCYVRRAVIDRNKNLMILVSKSTDHPSCRQSNDYVRVTSYDSRMVIRPHGSLHEDGFDYLLTYSDDPQSSFPSAAYNWMAYSGVPDFVNKLHAAAVRLNNETMSNQRSIQRAADVEEVKEEEPDSNNNNIGKQRAAQSKDRVHEDDEAKENEPSNNCSDNTISKSSGKMTSPATKVIPTSGGRIPGSGGSGSSLRVDNGHSLFHSWFTFFSR